MVAAPSTP
ncbi:hypothetical protein E2C01_067020 [Portunus trituberculatus]|uniref:Uncharacterized protein n=1 Tax=Portunus trituberculatus TaxID=210409 RepID=A0A5B7HVG9_PORTR|nr:hypothetical protein [Portunus trituberculatus]